MNKIQKTDHFYLIDGSGYIFRAYYALPPLTRKSDGLPTGAVSGFCSMLFKLLENSKSDQNMQKPTHFAVIFDSARKTFRNEIYSDYKANRSEAPDDLAPQFEYIRKSVLAFNLPSVDLPNYEADDLIATYVDQILKKGAKVTIVSSDKDLMQLYKKGVRIFDPMKNKFITDDDVLKKFGVDASKVIDVQSLAGDCSDNVPGVPGIGVKTAAELINKYGTLENLLKSANEIKQNKRRESIKEAYFNYGVKTFSLDTKDELIKIIESTNNAKDLELFVRVAVSNEHAEIDLSKKFGALTSEAIGLLRLVKQHAKKIGLSFHVGSQCMHPISYSKGISEIGNIIKKTKIIPNYINVGEVSLQSILT